MNNQTPEAELRMHCGFHGPHEAHVWQMSATGYCDCPGNPLDAVMNNQTERR